MLCSCSVHFLTKLERRQTPGIAWFIKHCPRHSSVETLEAKAALLDEAVEALRECLPILEQFEDEHLVGDEGCYWPVEIARAVLTKAEALKEGK